MAIPKNRIIPILILVVVVIGLAVRFLIFRPDFTYAGTIEATKVDVPARLSSVIKTVAVQEGDQVQADQTLLTLACEDFRLSSKLANDNFYRANVLFKEGSLSKQDFDIVENKKDDAELKVSWCDIRSPLAGTVLTRYHEAGEMVTPGTKLFTLADLHDLYAYIYVPQPLVASLKLNDQLAASLPEMPGQTFEGRISWIAAEAEFTPKNVQTQEERTRLVFAVKVTFHNNDDVLKPGMTVEVRLPRK